METHSLVKGCSFDNRLVRIGRTDLCRSVFELRLVHLVDASVLDAALAGLASPGTATHQEAILHLHTRLAKKGSS